MDKYSEKIKRILVATGWSQEVLAGKLGTSFVTLNSWVNGKSEPREVAKEKIDLIAAEVLGADELDKGQLTETKRRASKEKCSVQKLLGDRELLEELTTTLTYHNNATEGSTMTERDVHAVVYENQTLRNRTAVEQREAINHQTALYFLLDELAAGGSNFVLTPELIQATHLRMMNGIISDAGLWRDHGVRIRDVHVPLANYLKIPGLIEQCCNTVNGETADKIELLARAHANFEQIHPFSDGNGRTGRLLLFALALKFGLVPPILPRDRRVAYYKYLELAQTREITDPLELFIAESILATAEKMRQ